MSSVTPINSGRLPATPPVDPPAGETFVAGDLVAAMDDHSRALLGRSDLERRIRLVPRSLMIADLLGLSLAYLITTLFWGGSGRLRLHQAAGGVLLHPAVLAGRGQAPGPLPR